MLGNLVNLGLVAVTCIYLTEYTLTHILVSDDIDSLVALAIVHARELGVIAELVEYLYALYRLCGKRVKRRRYVLAEELLTIDKNLLYGLTLCLYLTICNGDTRHLLEQALHVSIVCHLESIGIVSYRITLLRCADSLHGLHYGLNLCSLLLDGNLAQIDSCGICLQVNNLVGITQERDFNLIISALNARDGCCTIEARGKEFCLILVVGLCCWSNSNHCTCNTLLRSSVNNGKCYLAALCIR